MKTTPYSSGAAAWLTRTLLFVLALLPLHAVITTAIISQVGFDLIISSWKELILLALVPTGLLLVLRDETLRRKLLDNRLNQLMIAYGLLHVLYVFIFDVDTVSETAGLLFNLRIFLIFGLAQIAGHYFNQEVRRRALRIVMAGVAIVSIFGALQVLVLPDDFLTIFGYGEETIESFQTIDQNNAFVRIISTLRGANPLGLYMILAFSLLAAWWRKTGAALSWNKADIYRLGVTLSAAVTLLFTFSRSGWLGTGVALLLYGLVVAGPQLRKKLLRASLVAAVSGALVFSLFGNSDFIQNVVLHQDPGESDAINSTEAHFEANQRALEDIARQPLGHGPGWAGPASFYGEDVRLAENYYLQVGQEVGVIGLGLFLAIIYMVGRNLWHKRSQPVALALFSSLIGLSVASLFLHVWTQDAVALTWWGLAGFYMYNKK